MNVPAVTLASCFIADLLIPTLAIIGLYAPEGLPGDLLRSPFLTSSSICAFKLSGAGHTALSIGTVIAGEVLVRSDTSFVSRLRKTWLM